MENNEAKSVITVTPMKFTLSGKTMKHSDWGSTNEIHLWYKGQLQSIGDTVTLRNFINEMCIMKS